ncbi:MAG TPA: hypothetical protein VJI33_04970 [Candidatus Paceibacterota bacterium]
MKSTKKGGINVSLIPIALARSRRARMGQHPCSTNSRLTPTWSELLRSLKAFGESLPKSIPKRRRARH